MTYAQDYYRKNSERLKAAARQHYYANRERRLMLVREYAATHREAVAAKTKAWQKANPERKRAYAIATRRRRNGFVGTMFDDILAAQAGKCAICAIELTSGLTERAACGDHCHETRRPRGILCKRCNLMLGHARDNQDILKRAIAYLDSFK